MSDELIGRITPVPSLHLGHLFLDCMQKRPDAVCQIDAATGEEESNASVLQRSVSLARAIRNFGIRPGDVLCLGGRRHLDLHIPFYAALLNGLPISGVDPYFKHHELKKLFQLARPKIAFCDYEMYEIYTEVIKDLELDTKIVTFGGDESSMKKFIESYDQNESVCEFKVANFDQDKIYAFLISTSGTSGKIKLAAIKHGVFISKAKKYMATTDLSDSELKINLNVSPINWISGFFNAIGLPLMKIIILQASIPNNLDHIIEAINKYKPRSTLFNPTLLSSLLSRKEYVDLTCFRVITITGSRTDTDMIAEFRKLLHKDAFLLEAYGMTETLGPCLAPNLAGPPGSCGRVTPLYEVKLVDPESGKEITDPYVSGEIWVKGEGFSGFYNDSEETESTHTEDGFYKSGDLLFRDENDNFYFVDRLKSLIKFRGFHILPAEIEDVIRTHPAVKSVCVCGIPHPEDRQRPLACIVLREGCHVTAQEIKDLVARNLSKHSELSGGVVFLDKLPMTSTDKIAQGKLLDLISHLNIQ